MLAKFCVYETPPHRPPLVKLRFRPTSPEWYKIIIYLIFRQIFFTLRLDHIYINICRFFVQAP